MLKYLSNAKLFITLFITSIHYFHTFITPNKNEKLELCIRIKILTRLET